MWTPYGWRPLAPPVPGSDVGARCGGRAIDGVIGAAIIVIAVLLAPDGRPVLGWLLGASLMAAYETAMVATVGATAGKLAVGLRVRELDRHRVSWAAATRRGTWVAFLEATVVGIAPLVWSVIQSANRRGFHDRRSGTFVVERAVHSVSTPELVGFEARARPAPQTPFGPTAGVEIRFRARLARLDGAPVLLAGLLPLLWVLEVGEDIGDVVLVSLLFLGVFVVDEAWRITRRGGTPGHHRAGLAVVDAHTGDLPSPRRAVLRAAVLAPLLYVPPLQLLLWIWTYRSRQWRGPHDRAGRTVVVRRP